jgi:transposase
MKALSSTKVDLVVQMLKSGHSGRHISSTLDISIASISKIRLKHCPDIPKSSGGRPTKLSPANIHYATHLIERGKADNAAQVTRTLQNIINQPLSSQTVRRTLKQVGLKAVVKRKRPFLSKRHRKARMDFAVTHLHWTVEDWKRVIWSDETKINRLGSDGRKWVYKRSGESLSDRLVEGTLKFGGGSIMMWGCMFWEGPGYACKIDGRMDGELYRQILDEDLQASLEYYGKDPTDIIFQQDNDPKHKSKKATEWFSDHDYQVLIWPAQSPDMNPIEHLWGHVKRQLSAYENAPNGIHELWERIEKEWNEIKPEVCQNLIESMPRRVRALYKAKGGYTKY